MVAEAFPQGNRQHTLITEKDVSQVIESLDRKFDFVVIDTGHTHPCESLNLIAILPYLTENAIVVLHDINPWQATNPPFTAPILLLSCIVAPKLQPQCDKAIAAFQITADTRTHISNVFYAFSFPWGYAPRQLILDSVCGIVDKYYDEKCQELFRQALDWNSKRHIRFVTKERSFTMSLTRCSAITAYLKSFRKIVFYGAGSNCDTLLNLFAHNFISTPHEIWDVNALEIKSKRFIPVLLPDFASLTPESKTLVIVTLNRDKDALPVMEELGRRGATFVRIKDLAGDLKKLTG
jgi:hypothetical protein